MKVKVKKCSKPERWYNKKIGQEFNVIDYTDNDYIVKSGLYDSAISKEDCEVIPDVVLSGTIGMETSKEPSGFKTIKMSLDTALEWYKLAKQNESNNTQPAISWLLENFTKEELEPKKGFTWEESFDGCGFFIKEDSEIVHLPKILSIHPVNKNIFKTQEQAESALAFAQLTHIVAKYNEGKKSGFSAYSVGIEHSKLEVFTVAFVRPNFHLVFFNKEDAETSLEVNKDLWKQYWMIK